MHFWLPWYALLRMIHRTTVIVVWSSLPDCPFVSNVMSRHENPLHHIWYISEICFVSNFFRNQSLIWKRRRERNNLAKFWNFLKILRLLGHLRIKFNHIIPLGCTKHSQLRNVIFQHTLSFLLILLLSLP